MVKDFEVGLFNGKYITDVPDGYFEHLSQLRGRKKAMVGLSEDQAGRAMLVANSGPMGIAMRQQNGSGDGAGMNGTKSPSYREDIRYVVRLWNWIALTDWPSLYNIGSEPPVDDK
jgi:amidophosphoribosyltransferase